MCIVYIVWKARFLLKVGGFDMARRQKMNRRKSKKSFTKGAVRVHRKNGMRSPVMRGGIRL